MAEALVEAGHEVVVIDSIDPSVHAVQPDPIPEVEYVWGDVRDPSVWSAVLTGVDAVCHHAARVGLGVDFADVRDYVDHNVAGTASMLWAMHHARFTGRLVLASSMVVYGEGACACDRDGAVRPPPRAVRDLARGQFEPCCPTCGAPVGWRPITEDAVTSPRNVYAATKPQQEQLCSIFGREHGVAVTALCYHNVYGPRMPRDTPYAGVASIFRSQLESGRAPLVFEDGGQVRDFVHVSDIARANVLALTTPDPYDGPLNIASGRPLALGEMARLLSETFGPDHRPQVTGRFRLVDVRHVAASPERAHRALGYRAVVAPHDGLRRFASDPLRLGPPLVPGVQRWLSQA